MKKSIIYIVVILLSLSACSGFLDEVPLSNVTDKNYYVTEEDAVGAVNAIYETVGIGSVSMWQGTGNENTQYGGIFYNDYWMIQDLFSDNAIHSDWRWANFDNHSLSEDDGQIKTLWYAFYRAINTANVAIEKIPAIDMNAEKRDHLIGEAKFWRGLLYAELVKLWGDVPLRLLPSSSINELYTAVRADQIAILESSIIDMQYAIDNLMDDYRAGYGRANAMMANAMMAKVYLIKATHTKDAQDYQKIVDYSDVVIKSGKYDLYRNYADNFIISKKHGTESIISINYETVGLWASQFLVALLPAEIRSNSPGGTEGPMNANSWMVPTRDLFNSFAAGDLRRDISIMKDYTYQGGSTYVFDGNAKFPYYYTKYWDRVAEPDGKNSGQNYPYMRYSDVLLMYAEALNEVSGSPDIKAYDAINKVRDRAFQDNGSGAHDLAGLSQTEFRKAILDERRYEFALEGSRWFDLVRLSTNFTADIKRVKPNSHVVEKHKLFPIPQYEILLNGQITQNEGY